MSIFSSIKVSEDMPFLALSASFLLVAPMSFPEKFSLFMGVVAMWLLLCDIKKKLADMLITHDSKATNDLSARDSKIFSRLNNIEVVHPSGFERIRSLEESVTSRFMSINVVIEDLQTKINQHYVVVQRSDFDQQSVSNESEANSTNESETDSRGSSTNSSSSSSSQRFANISSVIREQFIDIFNRSKGANDYSLDQMCDVVSVDILKGLGMVIGKDTIKGFYCGENINSENLEKIGAWIYHTHLHRY